ncbi:chromosome segregation protein SMC [Paludibacterium paludis]|uniref:Chromosome partition protein Smc n=1 Tax=Paludibacterium paludis TaxID=1225769 RepID=A0A918NZ52_9NEIS|nr:chromosome segregation protein SMC [Paludibacterium paludis]GGY08559.1 chromosome partition protein Smc [Paludibacterium paludis]
MRLTHIKLSGFKSFVDPTSIAVPGQLVAVIGPNGCGKSNVIDAVRWVLGESSARQLRGESMQDVIFNGSSTRKPVSRASVELVFDNGDGQLVGPWGAYAEVAIRRVLTRQGESSYFINGQQVRRRDITDLFLGTGVGARGYAVIEQGMISRIIEARPEELRAYLEEAAGVSRYKERRRETEHRLKDTRDNLERIEDLRQELERQVERLSEQAEVAGQYHDLRATLTQKQNLLALARREEAARNEAAARAELARIETEEAGLEAALTSTDVELGAVREAHFAAGDAVHEVQQRLFEANAAMARLEEKHRHREENRVRVEREKTALAQERQLLQASRDETGAELEHWRSRNEEARLVLEEARLCFEEGSEGLPETEARFREADAKLSSLQAETSRLTRERDLARQQAGLLGGNLHDLGLRETALRDELRALALPDGDALAAARENARRAAEAVDGVRRRLEADEERLADLAAERERLDGDLARMGAEVARLRAEQSARASLLAAAEADAALGDWVDAQGLASAPVLWQSLSVDAQWRVALEAVLGARLSSRAAPLAGEIPPARLTLVDGNGVAPPAAVFAAPCLRDKVVVDAPFAAALGEWLSGIYLAATLEEALSARAGLPPGAVFVTPEGHRVGRSFVTYHAAESGGGVMEQKTRLDELGAAIGALEPELETAGRRRDAVASQAGMLAEAIRAQKGSMSRLETERNDAALAEVRLDQAARQGARRLAAIEEELSAIAGAREDAKLRIDEAGLVAEEAEMRLEELSMLTEEARLGRLDAETGLELARNQSRDGERLVHEATLALSTSQQRLDMLVRRQEELDERSGLLDDKFETLVLEGEVVEEAVPEEALQEALTRREAEEGALALARDSLNGLTERLRELAQRQQVLQTDLPALRDARSACLLRHQEARLAMERFAEELAEAGVDETALLPLLTDAVKPSSLMSEIAKLARAIEGLGAVNLAALEELEEARKRGEYLAGQSTDLLEAMAMLEDAIRKIDGETRDLLKATYDAVNARMSEFFPTLFGGGRAELVLTGEDLLDAGIQIIAQPPGKKNSSIHLLSGGEKALTAMSLVFSLFSLNPAPFCLLDEVDAPLDDANTSRFCDLVKKMSENTQFLYISHNRLTMEMAEQLVGVTMQEQGVSRIVAVDIVEALKLRETA